MNYENVKADVRDGLLVLTIDRPKVLNALNAKTVEEIYQVFAAARDDEAVKAVIVTGSGEKAFVAGADINEPAVKTPVTGKETSERGQFILSFIEKFPKPVIAAINGFALGGGCELALACHMRFASENAKLGLPEVGLGIIPGYGGTQRLPRIVGLGRALELITTGNMIDAQEALRIGLVNRVYPLAELIPACEKIAQTILGKGALAIRYALDAAVRGMESDLTQGLEREAGHFGLLAATADMHEGLKAFLEKRKPNFTGA